MTEFTKRQVLAASVGTISALSGCSVLQGGGSKGIVLAGIEFGNASDNPVTFYYVVERDDEIIAWSSHRQDPDAGSSEGSTIVVPGIPDNPAPVTVHCRVGDQRRTTDFTAADYDSDCVLATFLYGVREEGLLSAEPIGLDRLDDPPDALDCPSGETTDEATT